jgi:hypothetical protein
VDGISFVIQGSTEELIVLETHNCVGGTAGVPSPEGGCCSEWIPCESGLECQPDGPVYPGSMGTCTTRLQGDCPSPCPSGQICCFVWGVGGPSTGVNQCLVPESTSIMGNGCPPNI